MTLVPCSKCSVMVERELGHRAAVCFPCKEARRKVRNKGYYLKRRKKVS